MDTEWTSDCGTVRLVCGDCFELVPNMPDGHFSGVITDPPYSQKDTHESHLSKITLRDGTPAGKVLEFDGITEDVCSSLVFDWCRVAARWVVFTCEWKFLNRLDADGNLVRFGIWRKPDGSPQFTGDRPGTGWEAVAICHRKGRKRWNGGGHHAFWNYPKGQNDSGHPTGKPLGLFLDFVEQFTDRGEAVLDPFMGSGTTGVACARLGRQFIGIEKDPKYFKIAKRRIREELERFPLLEKQPEPEQLSIFKE